MALANFVALAERFVRRYGLIVFWGLSVFLIAMGARSSGHAFGSPWSYPIVAVIVLIVISAGETGILHLLLRPTSYERSWGRAFVALLIFRFWAVFLAIVVADQPGFLIAHVSWLHIVCAALIFLFFVSAIASIRLRAQEKHG